VRGSSFGGLSSNIVVHVRVWVVPRESKIAFHCASGDLASGKVNPAGTTGSRGGKGTGRKAFFQIKGGTC